MKKEEIEVPVYELKAVKLLVINIGIAIGIIGIVNESTFFGFILPVICIVLASIL